MDITRKRIINPQRYLYALHPGDKFYIAVPLAEEDYPRLQFYGLLPDSPARIPIPRREGAQAAIAAARSSRSIPTIPAISST